MSESENDFQRASMRGLGKKILLGDESVEPVSIPEPTDNPGILKLTPDEEQALVGSVSTTPTSTQATNHPEAIPVLESEMPVVADLSDEMLPLTEDLQSIVETGFETVESLSQAVKYEAMPVLEDEPADFVSLDPAQTTVAPEIIPIIDENFESWSQSVPVAEPPLPPHQPASTSEPSPSSTAAAAERNELSHLLPLIAGWVVAILVLIYQLIRDAKKDEEQET